MDIKSEFEIKEELLESSGDPRNIDQNIEEDSWMEQFQEKKFAPNIGVKKEFGIKIETWNFDQHIQQISGLEENQEGMLNEEIEPTDELENFNFSDDDDEPDGPTEVNSMYDSDEHVEYMPDEEEEEDSMDEDELHRRSAGPSHHHPMRSRRHIEIETNDPSNLIHKLKDGNYFGKNNKQYVWSTRPMFTGGCRTFQPRTQKYSSKPKYNIMETTSEIECLALFFDDQFYRNVVRYTNLYIDRITPRYSLSRNVKPTDTEEMKALVGILIISGVRKDNRTPTSEMWHHLYGYNLYRAGMSEGRFNFLLRCLRFDDLNTRVQRQKEDKFAPARGLWSNIISKCTTLYEPGTYITVDEQLLGFRGRCSFLQYIANNPSKSGIKLIMACDAETKYVLNAIPYLGAHTKLPKGMMLGEFFTTELVKPYFNTQRSITTGNWFTSHSLAVSLLEKDITLCGTLRKKPYVPEEMLNVKSMKKGTSSFLYDDKTTLVSYKAKDKKLVLLLSSEHREGKIGNKNKPEIVEHYDKTKGGVDVLGFICAKYSCSRKTKRWPLCLFYGIINFVVTNAYIIYKHRGPQNYARRAFMYNVGFELIKENATRRYAVQAVPRNIKIIISELYCIRTEGVVGSDIIQKRTRCQKCPRKEDRKTKKKCIQCKIPVCERHIATVCHDCIQGSR